MHISFVTSIWFIKLGLRFGVGVSRSPLSNKVSLKLTRSLPYISPTLSSIPFLKTKGSIKIWKGGAFESLPAMVVFLRAVWGAFLEAGSEASSYVHSEGAT